MSWQLPEPLRHFASRLRYWFFMAGHLRHPMTQGAFRVQGGEEDIYASASLRLAILVIIWIHMRIMNTIMIFEL